MTVQKVVDLLNQWNKKDPEFIYSLFRPRLPCNKDLASDENFVCLLTSSGYEAGCLGVVNGILSSILSGERIAAVFKQNRIEKFIVFEDKTSA